MQNQWREIDYSDEEYDEIYMEFMDEKKKEERQHKLDLLLNKNEDED